MGRPTNDFTAGDAAEADARWRGYAAAMRRAQSTLDIRDGIAAGKAWREWLVLFVPPEQRGIFGSFRGRQ